MTPLAARLFHVFFLSCVCYDFVRVCLYVPCGHLLGKGWPLCSRLWCLTVSLLLSHWYPGSGVVLDCIHSWSLHPNLLWTSNPSIPSLMLDQLSHCYCTFVFLTSNMSYLFAVLEARYQSEEPVFDLVLRGGQWSQTWELTQPDFFGGGHNLHLQDHWWLGLTACKYLLWTHGYWNNTTQYKITDD